MSNSAQAWRPPTIAAGAVVARATRKLEELQGGERRAWLEAESTGKAAGLAAAQQEIDVLRKSLTSAQHAMESALQALSRPLARLDDQLHEQIARLAAAIARGLVRRELRADPTQIIGIVRETVALLPASTRGVRVMLHPDDAGLVRERLATQGAEQAWSIVEDPVLSRGDCRVHTDYAQIDARVESQLNAALSALFGDERDAPRTGVET
jgi:flagellar assembly protein FliH